MRDSYFTSWIKGLEDIEDVFLVWGHEMVAKIRFYYVSVFIVALPLSSWRINSSTEHFQLLQDQFLLHRVKSPMHWLCIKILQIFEPIPSCLLGANLAIL